MRPLAAVLAGALLAACAPAAARFQPTVMDSGTGSAGQPILISEGGIMRPITNGGRVAIRNGWARLTFSPYPLARQSDLDIALEERDGRSVGADVVVTYEMLEMDHGRITERAVPRGAAYRMPLSLAMYGSWRFTIRVTRGSEVETLAVVVGQ